MKTLKWIWWHLYYAVRHQYFRFKAVVDFNDYFLMTRRTWNPWKKFRPSAYRCEYTKDWHIYLEDKPAYTSYPPVMMKVTLLHDMEDGRVIGFEVWDETLEQLKAKE